MALIDKETIRAEIERRRNAWLEKSRLIKKRRDAAMYAAGKSSAYAEFLSYIDSLSEQPKLKPMNIPSGGGAMGTTPPKFKLDVKPEQPVIKKSNALFDKCVKNCDPAVMKEVSDNIDKILGRQPVEGRLEMAARYVWESWNGGTMDDVRRDMKAIGNVLNARKEQPVEGLEEEIRRYLREECSGDDEPLVSEIARHFAEWGAEHAIAPHYFELRELKTGRVFFAEWSDIAGEWYERGNGKAYQSDEVEIVQHAKK